LTLNLRRKLNYISYTPLECTNRADQQTRQGYKNTTYTEVLLFMRVITVVRRKTDGYNEYYS